VSPVARNAVEQLMAAAACKMDWPIKPSLLHGLEAEHASHLLERLLAIADDAVIVADAQQRIVLFNEGAERCFGYRAAEVLGRPLDQLIPPAQRERHAGHMRVFSASPLAARRMGERRDLQGLRADATLFDAEASISHIELDGRTYFTAILRDVSEASRAERALAASEARFRGLAAAAPVGIFQTDAAGACVYVNERWCEIAGMSADEAAGQGWLRALHPADRAAVCDAWRDAVAARRAFQMRYRFLRPDGSESWVMGSAVASHTDAAGNGQADAGARVDAGYIGTVTDITETHHQALALERAKSEAEAAARAKSLFLANMSHEIRTPLNAVIGMTTLLLDTPMSPEQRDFARTIRGSGESLLEIINDILDYSKADVGKIEIEQRPFDLRAVVEESLDLLSPRALEKGLNLACLIEDGTPEALIGDSARVRQILVNLLSNAVKFTHQGEVFVSVDSERVDATHERVHFAVRDSGIGIAAEHLPRLFQSFTQVDASTTRRFGGTGLGLAISRRLAELMGGDVSAESEPGRGSVFHARVLVERAHGEAQAEFLQRDAPALRGKRILIVDDNLTNRRILTQLALRWGMRPATLPSALEALDRVRHGEPFDIAVLDLSMPDVDGLELAAEIRRKRGPAELPIVLLTSLGQRHADGMSAPGRFAPAPQGGEQASWGGPATLAHAGLSACLNKPIKAGVLFATLVAALDGSASLAAAPAPAAAPPPRTAPLRILIAEDHPTNQRVVQRLLQHLGHSADIAADGRETVAAARRERYDVVLMDIQMPELDGVQATREIVRQRGDAALPRIVAMTANVMPGDREAYLAAGMDGYLAKPIALADLADALVQTASLWRPSERAPGQQPVLDAARLEHLRSIQDDNQPSLVRELIDQFLAESSAHLQRLRDAHGAGDATALRALAHRFLSSTQNIGAQRMAALCEELESMARRGELALAEPLVAQLAEERRQAHEALAAARLRY
jgi:PAS domain S-box-containing protein